MARKLFNVSESSSSDKLVKVTTFRNNTRTALNDSSSRVIWSANFTKEYDANTSWILMEGMLPGANNYSDQCGVYAMLDGANTNNDSPRYHGIHYSGANADHGWARFIMYVHRIIDNSDSTQELSAGSRTWSVGWHTRNGASGDKPFEVWNPNSSDDSRNQQYGSLMSIYEYLY
tara:strand:+ start:1923 stop:2444 length:522 start_codon:yes stop_codon:yes gene_type:complete